MRRIVTDFLLKLLYRAMVLRYGVVRATFKFYIYMREYNCDLAEITRIWSVVLPEEKTGGSLSC